MKILKALKDTYLRQDKNHQHLGDDPKYLVKKDEVIEVTEYFYSLGGKIRLRFPCSKIIWTGEDGNFEEVPNG
jgi:hypothetical protein